MRELTLAGAGLAGLALANSLSRAGVPTTLHEAHTLPRHRVCGEFICGRGAQALHQLDLGSSLEGAKQHRSVLWFRQNRPIFRCTLPAPAFGISRYLLDQRLADSFREAGGNYIEKSRLQTDAPSPGTVICSGRQAEVSDWIGLKFHLSDFQTQSDLELHLGTNSYLGLSAIEDKRVNVCGLFKRRPELKAHKSELALHYLHASGLHGIAKRLESATIDPNSHVGVAGIAFSAGQNNHSCQLRLGDADSVIPPFTGNGMSIALESAAIAHPILLEYANGHLDWGTSVQRIQAQLHESFKTRLRCAKAIHPWLHHPNRQHILAIIARLKLLPFQTLYKLTH